ncbi:hypothetical protein BN59_02827 [Legionella massiliensis]|uniref:Uncharacterized protein n=1 Tax=Legionella massiliensis TaxID=1034943 RepID=A0A078KZU3_9GAMM|nr:hypothetical protein [Legionella massiliensis]CDZ78517.1 hypothetical protein BN59_02827 [Legionella massiliensis]CEE14255.1 hypothetical protein BN1094_02827 [Legionella massiliensis]
MIIVMSRASINQEAAQILANGAVIQNYPELDLEKNADEEITIIELKADGVLQTLLDPKLFANQLITAGLSQNVQRINFIVSDICMGHSMFKFAQEFCDSLKAKNITVSVQLAGDLNYLTFLSPPGLTEHNWQVYGIRIADYASDLNKMKFEPLPLSLGENSEKKTLSHDFLMTYDKKKLLWEGEDLVDWLTAEADRVITPADSGRYFHFRS